MGDAPDSIRAWLRAVGVSTACDDSFRRSGYASLRDVAERITSVEQIKACGITNNAEICAILNALPALRNQLGVDLHRPPAYDGLPRATSVATLDISVDIHQHTPAPLYEIDLGDQKTSARFQPQRSAEVGAPPPRVRYEHKRGAFHVILRGIVALLGVAIGVMLAVSLHETFVKAPLVGKQPLPVTQAFSNGTVVMRVDQPGECTVSIMTACLEQNYVLSTPAGIIGLTNWTCIDTITFFDNGKSAGSYALTIVAILGVAGMTAVGIMAVVRHAGAPVRMLHVGMALAVAFAVAVLEIIGFGLMLSLSYENMVNTVTPVQGLGWYQPLALVDGEFATGARLYAASIIGTFAWMGVVAVYMAASRVVPRKPGDVPLTIVHLTPPARTQGAAQSSTPV